MELFWSWVTVFLLFICSLGTVLPLLPGLPLMAVIIIGYGWFDNFQNINLLVITIAVMFAVIGTLLDYLAGPYLAKKKGGTKGGYWGAFLGGLVGIVFLGPIGLLLGPFLGALAGELLGGKSLKDASQIGVTSLWGMLAGNVLKFVLAISLTVIFFFRVFL
ncbi:MAG: DUF456 domain-containing protein [Firmicutes bacterium HGW-Firmicutes-12]|nr:MAG: DUF456 domain-containing protein [Firmicutes bacterium HGW-Firmicutes-12]